MRIFLLFFLSFLLLSSDVLSEQEEELGPHFVRRCPKCNTRIVQPIILAGNTVGAKFWSDGKMEAPMLPDCPKFVKCPHCMARFWIDEAAKVMPPKPGEEVTDNEKAADYLIPKEQDYYDELATDIHHRRKEIYLRFRAWHAFNDKWRGKKEITNLPLSGSFITNLQKLDKLLDGRDEGEVIMKAEIARELGDYDAALALLDRKFDKRIVKVVDFIAEQCRKKNRKVVEIKEELFAHSGRQGNLNLWLEISIWCIIGVFLCIFGIHTVRRDKRKNNTIVYNFDNLKNKGEKSDEETEPQNVAEQLEKQP